MITGIPIILSLSIMDSDQLVPSCYNQNVVVITGIPRIWNILILAVFAGLGPISTNFL